jgi:hypothetical protein
MCTYIKVIFFCCCSFPCRKNIYHFQQCQNTLSIPSCNALQILEILCDGQFRKTFHSIFRLWVLIYHHTNVCVWVLVSTLVEMSQIPVHLSTYLVRSLRRLFLSTPICLDCSDTLWHIAYTMYIIAMFKYFQKMKISKKKFYVNRKRYTSQA